MVSPFLPCPCYSVKIIWILKSYKNWLNWFSRIECTGLKIQQSFSIGGCSFRRQNQLRPTSSRIGIMNRLTSSNNLINSIFSRVWILPTNIQGTYQLENVTKKRNLFVLCSTDNIWGRYERRLKRKGAAPAPNQNVKKGCMRGKY